MTSTPRPDALQTRDGRRFTAEQLGLLRRAAPLFERLAATDPRRVRLLDRRERDADALVETMITWIAEVPARPFTFTGPAAAPPP